MNRSWKLALLIGLTIAVLAACGGGDKPPASAPENAGSKTSADSSTQPAAMPTEAADVKPADTPAGPQTSAEGEELSVADREVGLNDLDSYRATWYLEWKSSGAEKNEDVSWEWVQEFTREPRAEHLRWESLDRTKQDAQPESMEYWKVGDTTYIVTPESDGTTTCISTSSEDGDAGSSPMGPATLGSVDGAKLIGTETVNGVKARHYRYDEKSMALFGGGKVKGDIWVAVDGGFVVKDTATWEGSLFLTAADDKTTGSGSWTWELTEINGSLSIVAPENCESATTGLPILPDATEKASFGDLLTYKSATKQADVLKFYQEEMKKAGWSEEGEATVTEQFANLTFSKDGATASLMVNVDGGMSNIILTVEKAK